MTPEALAFVVALTVQFGTLAGVATLVAALINVLKVFGVVQDGTADQWKAFFSLIAFVILVVVGVFRPDLSAVIMDQKAAQIATVLIFITGFLVQTGLAPIAHKALSGFPVIGTSFTTDGMYKPKTPIKGQGMVEYALILVLVAVVVIAALTVMGPLVRDVFSTINASLTLPGA
jgi:pilus assembly protein Flp/PilA